MKKVKREIDLTTEEKRKEFFNILDKFNSKTEAYEYIGVSCNSNGIRYLKELANKVGFNLDTYAERRSLKPKKCVKCGKEFIPNCSIQKFCSHSCCASYNNKRRSNETLEKLRNSLKKYHRENPKKINLNAEFTWVGGKKIRIKPKKCPICGSGDCERKGICNHTKKFFENLVYFGFDKNSIGTDRVFEEYERVKRILESEYFVNHLSPSELKEKYHYPKTFENITQILKTMEIKTRSLSSSQKNALLTGRNVLPTSEHEIKLGFKQGWHITWEGKKIFYRSGAELKYAELLDEEKVSYDVESLRIVYYDTVKRCNRIAIPDFLLTKTNEIVEIKSKITFCKQNMIDKFKKYKELGYKPRLLYEGVMYNYREMKNIKEYTFILRN